MSAIPSSPSSQTTPELPSPPGERIRTLLREQLQGDHGSKSERALVAHLLAEESLLRGDYAGAARQELLAVELEPSFAEPIESLIAIAHLRRSKANLPHLLGHLLQVASTPETETRALLELLAELATLHDPESSAELNELSEKLLETDGGSSVGWLWAELVATKTQNPRAKTRAALGRIGVATSSEVRAALLARVARQNWQADELADAFASLEQSLSEQVHPPTLREFERHAIVGRHWDLARKLVTVELEALRQDRAEDDPTRLQARELPLLMRQILFAWLDGDRTSARDLAEQMAQREASDFLFPLTAAVLAELDNDDVTALLYRTQAAQWAPAADRPYAQLVPAFAERSQIPLTLLDALPPSTTEAATRTHALLAAPTDPAATRRALATLAERLLPTDPSFELVAWLLLSKFEPSPPPGNLAPIVTMDGLASRDSWQSFSSAEKKLFVELQTAAGLVGAVARSIPLESLDLLGAASSANASVSLDPRGAPQTLFEQLAALLDTPDLPSKVRFAIELLLIDRGLASAARNDAETRLFALLDQNPTHPTLLARAITLRESDPAFTAKLWFKAAEHTDASSSQAEWALRAGLDATLAQDTNLAAKAFALAEQAVPGCLGSARGFLPGFVGPTDPLDPLDRAQAQAQALVARDLTSATSLAHPDSPTSALLAALAALADGNAQTGFERLDTLNLEADTHLAAKILMSTEAHDFSAALASATRWEQETASLAGALTEWACTLRGGVELSLGAQSRIHQKLPSRSSAHFQEAEDAARAGDVERAFLHLRDALRPGPSQDIPAAPNSNEEEEKETPLSAEQAALETAEAFHLLTRTRPPSPDDATLARTRLLHLHAHFPNDPTIHLGLLAVAEALGDLSLEATALAFLATTTNNRDEARRFWARVGFIRETHETDIHGAIHAYERTLELDPGDAFAFDRLHALVRSSSDPLRTLELLELRLDSSLEPDERISLLWEQARLSRELERFELARSSLEALLELSPDALQAHSLRAEIALRQNDARSAAEHLEHVARHPDTHEAERIAASMHAADLFERLGEGARALALLDGLDTQGNNDPQHLRLRARAAIASENWALAQSALLEDNEQSDNLAERLQAAELIFAIQRDHLRNPEIWRDATRRVLRDAPLHQEAVEAVLTLGFSAEERRILLRPSLERALEQLKRTPLSSDELSRFLRLAEGAMDADFHRIAFGLATLSGRSFPTTLPPSLRPLPQGQLTPGEREKLFTATASPQSLEFLKEIARAIAHLTDPNLNSLGLSPLLRVHSHDDHPLFDDIAPWMSVWGIENFELYVGGLDPKATFVLGAGTPCVVLGSDVPRPLPARVRARLVAELFLQQLALLPVLTLPEVELDLWITASHALVDDGLESNDEASSENESNEEITLRTNALLEVLRPTHGDARSKAEWSASGRIALRADPQLSSARDAARVAALNAAILAEGDASPLKFLQSYLPQDPKHRTVVLEECLRFALGSEMPRLRRKLGMS